MSSEGVPEEIVGYYRLCSVQYYPRMHFLSDLRKHLADREAAALLRVSGDNLVSAEKIIGGGQVSVEVLPQRADSGFNVRAALIRVTPATSPRQRQIIVI